MKNNPPPESKNKNTESGNIFIIDDDPDIIAMMKTVIRKAGYNVETATDPEAALRQDLPFKPDIILTDIMMPQLSGFELIDRIRESCEDRGIRIIAVSALKSPGDIERAIEAGAADFLAKPFHPEEVLVRIERQMEYLRIQALPAEEEIGLSSRQKRNRAGKSGNLRSKTDLPEVESMNIGVGPRLMPSGAKILVIDDDPEIRDLLKISLKKLGHRIYLAADGEGGLAIAEREEPDLIILDILMPGLSGYDVARKLAESPHMADIPILMLSARGSSQEIAQGLLGFADDYVTKPFQTDELMARVGALIRRTHQHTREKREQQWVIQLLADKALNKNHQIFSRHITGEKELPSWWKAPSPDLLTKWGNSYHAYLVESVESLHDERTISRWKTLEEMSNVRLFVVGISRETAQLARKIKSERGFQAQIKWARPRTSRDSRWKKPDSVARQLMYAAAVVVLLASLFVSGVIPNFFDLIAGVNPGMRRQLTIYQPRDTERSLKSIKEEEIRLKEEKRKILRRP